MNAKKGSFVLQKPIFPDTRTYSWGHFTVLTKLSRMKLIKISVLKHY